VDVLRRRRRRRVLQRRMRHDDVAIATRVAFALANSVISKRYARVNE
jgi:hypothetical protein